MAKMSLKRLTEYFEFLDELRESRATNMFGARPYLERAFPALGPVKAGEVLAQWMKSFDNSKSPRERARTHVALPAFQTAAE